jgi:hypothetical protein
MMAILFVSCGNDVDKKMLSTIVGKWAIYEAKMNNKPNGLMKDGYFEFKDDKTVFSNLFDENNPHIYTVEDERLLIDTKENFDFKIKSIGSDTIVLEGRMKIFFMKYSLKRIE